MELNNNLMELNNNLMELNNNLEVSYDRKKNLNNYFLII